MTTGSCQRAFSPLHHCHRRCSFPSHVSFGAGEPTRQLFSPTIISPPLSVYLCAQCAYTGGSPNFSDTTHICVIRAWGIDYYLTVAERDATWAPRSSLRSRKYVPSFSPFAPSLVHPETVAESPRCVVMVVTRRVPTLPPVHHDRLLLRKNELRQSMLEPLVFGKRLDYTRIGYFRIIEQCDCFYFACVRLTFT